MLGICISPLGAACRTGSGIQSTYRIGSMHCGPLSPRVQLFFLSGGPRRGRAMYSRFVDGGVKFAKMEKTWSTLNIVAPVVNLYIVIS